LTEASRMLERYFYFPKEVLCENMDWIYMSQARVF
jgi:hypothetical protein